MEHQQNQNQSSEEPKKKAAPKRSRKKPDSQNKILAEAIMLKQGIDPEAWQEEAYTAYIQENSETLVAALQK